MAGWLLAPVSQSPTSAYWCRVYVYGYGCMHRIYIRVCMYVCMYVCMSWSQDLRLQMVSAWKQHNEKIFFYFWGEKGGQSSSEILFKTKEKPGAFYFSSNKETPILLLHLISILNSQVTHIESIQKYTEVVITRPWKRWLPSVTLGHQQNPTPPHAPNRSVKWQMLASYPPTLQKERGIKIVT